MKKILLTTFIYFAAFFLAGVLLPPMAVLVLFTRGDKTRRLPGRLIRWYGKALFKMFPLWKYRIEGEPPKDIGNKGYVVVANHQTTGDIYLLCNVPWDMRWVTKVELMQYVPFFGQLLWLSGDIPVKRGNKASVVRMMEKCRETLTNGLSVMIFPEGTRTKSRQLGPFKDGAFRMAIESGRPILPLTISGTKLMWPRGTYCLGEATGTIRIHPAVPTEGLTLDDLPRLKAEVRQVMLDALVASGDKDRDEAIEAPQDGSSQKAEPLPLHDAGAVQSPTGSDADGKAP